MNLKHNQRGKVLHVGGVLSTGGGGGGGGGGVGIHRGEKKIDIATKLQ